MSQSIQRMKHERKRHRPLNQQFRNNRPTSKRSRNTRGFQMPSESRGDEVRETEEVEAPREDGAGDSVERGEIPCYLGLVDAQVG